MNWCWPLNGPAAKRCKGLWLCSKMKDLQRIPRLEHLQLGAHPWWWPLVAESFCKRVAWRNNELVECYVELFLGVKPDGHMWIRVFKIDPVCLRLGPFTKREHWSDTKCDEASGKNCNTKIDRASEMQMHISSITWHSGLGGHWNVESKWLAARSRALTVISSPFFSNVIIRMPCFFPCIGALSIRCREFFNDEGIKT